MREDVLNPNPAAHPLTGAYHWVPVPPLRSLTWRVLTCHDVGFDEDEQRLPGDVRAFALVLDSSLARTNPGPSQRDPDSGEDRFPESLEDGIGTRGHPDPPAMGSSTPSTFSFSRPTPATTTRPTSSFSSMPRTTRTSRWSSSRTPRSNGSSSSRRNCSRGGWLTALEVHSGDIIQANEPGKVSGRVHAPRPS